jgi:hypothetical protein
MNFGADLNSIHLTSVHRAANKLQAATWFAANHP